MNKRRGGSNSNRASSTNSVKVGGVAGLNSNSNSDNCGGGVVVADDEESNRLNSSAVRRIDPTFAKLHGTASQVAVYRYNSSTQSWVRFSHFMNFSVSRTSRFSFKKCMHIFLYNFFFFHYICVLFYL